MERIKQISGLDKEAMREAKEQWDSIAKPLNSLGLLEQAVIELAGILQTKEVSIQKRCAVIFCADNGVVEEGVTQTGSEVTRIVAESIAQGVANISRMAQTFQAKVLAVDIGMNEQAVCEGVCNRRVAAGTKNMTKEMAMTREEAMKALQIGMDIAKACKEDGMDILISGEMGIGNTTAASAIASVLLELPIETVTGRGAGLDTAGLNRKQDAIRRAIQKHQPKKEDPIGVLAAVGSFDIAGMAGLCLGAAVYHIPVVIDGVISAVAALLATRIKPECAQYLLASHVSKEPAGQYLLDAIGKKAIIHGELCLGEGTGGIFLLPLLDGALSVYQSAHRFDELPMDAYQPL